MSLNKLIGMAALFGSILPSEKDWEPHLDRCRKEYNDAKKFPRKLKKQKRKEALYNWNFYKKMQSYNPFEI